MLSASYDPKVYPNPRFMKLQEKSPWHVSCTPLQTVGGLRQCFWQVTSWTLSATNNSNGIYSACFAGCRCLGRRGRDSTAEFGSPAASSRSSTTIPSCNNPTPRLASPSTWLWTSWQGRL